MSRCSTATVNVRYVGPSREHKHADGFSHALIAVSITLLLHTNPDSNRLLLEFIHILERRLIDPLLHDAPELVIDWIERAVGGHRSREDLVKSEVSRSNSSISSRADVLVR